MFDDVLMRKEEAFKQLGFWDTKERESALFLVEVVARKIFFQRRLPNMGFDGRSILETKMKGYLA